MPVDGAAIQGELVSIDASGRITFRDPETKDKKSETRTLTLDELVRWGHPVALRPQSIVVLADGGRIVTAADWAGGAAVRLDRDGIVLLSDTWNEVRLPRALVCGIVFAQQQRAEERERLVERVRRDRSPDPSPQGTETAASDAVLLTNGDRLTGKLAELDRGSLGVETSSGVAKLPLSRVEAIVLSSGQKAGDSPAARPQSLGKAEAAANPSVQGKGNLAVGLRDGSLIYAKGIRADEKEVAIEVTTGVKLKGDAVDDLALLQSLDGRIVYLSDLEPSDYRYVPYLSIAWPYTRDRNVRGEPLIIRGKRYLKGIGMHSAARLTYRFDSAYRRFDAAVAIDDSAKGRGSVTFGAYVLREGQWGEAYKSGVVRGGDAPLPVSIDLRGARGLTLTVDYADRGDELDHAAWLDSRLVQ